VDGIVTFRVGRKGEALIADWPGVARLTCGPEGARPRFVAAPNVDRAFVAKLRDGAVRALLGDLAGGLGLHASAVALGGRAMLLLGQSGAGKSTAAAELCLHHGATLLADDVAMLEVSSAGVRVLPTERQHHLTRTSCGHLGVSSRRVAGDKIAVPAKRRGGARSGYPLGVVAVLRFDDRRSGPQVRRIRGAEGVKALVQAVIRFDVSASRPRELDQLAALHRTSIMVEATRPRRTWSASSTVSRLAEILVERPRSGEASDG